MHPKELHEQIITSKLEALPIPNLADAIWARIELQLDIDMPTDEGGDVPEPPAPTAGGGSGMMIGAGLLAVVGALIVSFFLQPPKTNKSPLPQPGSTTIDQPNSNAAINTSEGNRAPVPGNTPLPATAIRVPTILPADSIAADVAASTPLQQDDSIATTDATVQAQVPEPTPPAKDSIPKKRKGLQGISDADYRIVPKKDST